MAVATDGYWFGGLFGADAKNAEGRAPRAGAAVRQRPRGSAPASARTGLWMPKAGKNKDAAWAVMEWFLAGDPAKARATGGWGIPPLKSLQKLMPQTQPFQKQAYQVQMAEQKYFSVMTFTPYVRAGRDRRRDRPGVAQGDQGNTCRRPSSPTRLNTQINAQLADGKKRLR